MVLCILIKFEAYEKKVNVQANFYSSPLCYNVVFYFLREDLLNEAKPSSSKLQEHKNLILFGMFSQ